MTRKELFNKIGLKNNQLISTNFGLMDVLGVTDDIVSYGFLANGRTDTMPAEDFCAKFQK